jgi:hypothetical protein
LLAGFRLIHDSPDFFDAIANIYAAVRDRIEKVTGRGNFKWLIPLVLLASGFCLEYPDIESALRHELSQQG